MTYVKTAISIEKSVYLRVEEIARELNLPRSRIFALAVGDLLERYDSKKLLQRINEAWAEPLDQGERAWLRESARQMTARDEG